MPRKETPATRADPTPGKPPLEEVGDRGQRRPAARRTNERKVDEAAQRDRTALADEAVQERR